MSIIFNKKSTFQNEEKDILFIQLQIPDGNYETLET